MGALLEGTRVEFNPNGTLKADPVTYQTAEPDIFTGGDNYTDQDLLLMPLQQARKDVYPFIVLCMRDRALRLDVTEDSSLSWIKIILKLRPLIMQNVRFLDTKMEMQNILSVICEAHLRKNRYRRKQTAAWAVELPLLTRISVSAAESVQRNANLMPST